jgi:hypothetical protein
VELRDPLGVLVDVLTPAGDGYDGSVTLFGVTVGRFRMNRRAAGRHPGP